MPRPTIPDRANTILRHARELFLAKGYDATTMAEIARRAGISKGAVYLEFPSKEALLDALLARSVRELAAAVRARVAAAAAPVPLSALYRYAVDALLADELMLAWYTSDPGVLGSYVRGKGPARYGPRMDWLAEHLAELRAAGLLRADVDTDAAATVLGVFAIGLIHASATVGPLSPERLRSAAEAFAGLIAAGWETGGPAASGDRARAAHLRLIAALDRQLGGGPGGAAPAQQETTPEETP
ncbi:MAG: helix-turn-helix domain-containing protein [Actinomycetes bacterium]